MIDPMIFTRTRMYYVARELVVGKRAMAIERVRGVVVAPPVAEERNIDLPTRSAIQLFSAYGMATIVAKAALLGALVFATALTSCACEPAVSILEPVPID
jgi:hypothetical protein